MKTKFLCALVLFAAACSGTQTKTGGVQTSDTLALKKAAAEAAKTSAHPSSDPCAVHSWYGDGVCDTFCAQADSDCVSDGTGTVCAAFSEVEDGTCSRPESDLCRFQDPDCRVPSTGGGDGVACAAYIEQGDGVCKRAVDDPCRGQDPDCGTNGGGSAGSSNDGPACIAIGEEPNGKCERPATDPCRSTDPDCVVACAQYIEAPDGVCKREPNDPCKSQDPDCK